MIGSISALNLIWIIPLALAVIAAIVVGIVRSIRRRRRHAAVLRSERPGSSAGTRPPRRRGLPCRLTVHGGHLTVFDDARQSSATLGAAGVEVHSAAAVASLAWDRFRDGRTPEPGSWAVRDDVIDAFIVAMVVTWAHGASSRPDATGAHEVSLAANWDDADWACFHALLQVVARRPDLRAALDDPVVAEHIARDIEAFNPMLPPQRFGSTRRQVTELDTAMKGAGFVHQLERPLPNWAIPSLDDAVAQVRQQLAANPLARDVTVDDNAIVERVRLNYLDIDPWPFGALLGH